jgi:hypothetical protein
MSVRCPIDLNNIAIAKLKEEKPNEAIHLLRLAMMSIKNQFAKRDTSPRESSQEQVPSVSCFDHRSHRRQQFPFSSSGSSFDFQGYYEQEQYEESPSCDSNDEDCEQITDLDGSIFTPFLHSVAILSDAALHQSKDLDQSILSLYDRAFFIGNDENADQDSVSSVLVYNLALVNHLCGIEKNDQTYLTKALKLYHMSLTIGLQVDSAPLDADVLIMALYNNIAHIHFHQFRIAETRSAMGEMRSLILESEHTSPLLNEDDYSLFYLNAIFSQGILNLNSAPAA